jgi:hypothetical protein
MFDRTTHVHNTTLSPSHISIHEHRAPTDESIKIYREIEQKAIDNIVAAGRVEDNIINFKWFIRTDHMSFDDEICRCEFTLNGKVYNFEFVLPRHAFERTPEVLGEKIHEEILKSLKKIFAGDFYKTCVKTLADKYQSTHNK